MMWLEKIVRPEINALQAYSSARSEYEGECNIQLDANESPWSPYGGDNDVFPLNRYPEPQPKKLRAKLAEIYKTEPNKLLITRGMDEGIDLLVRVFCRPGQDAIITTPPTFGYYEVAANIAGVKVNAVSLIEEKGFQFLIEEMASYQPQSIKLVFLCSPNNPTGSIIPLNIIEQTCEQFMGKAIVAVDEAYIEFSDCPSAISLLPHYENLVVMRTLSKAYGLAGARIGSLIADSKIINICRKILPPYPIPCGSVQAALEALTPLGIDCANQRIQQLKKQKKYLSSELLKSQEIEKIYSSEANFILVKAKEGNKLYDRLKEKGIVIRNRNAVFENTLRITVGLPEENEMLLRALGINNGEVFQKRRQAEKSRKTKETEIMIKVDLDADYPAKINTGIGFFDHMLEQLGKHGRIGLEINAIGDLHIDLHHTVEDVAIVLGEVLKEALGDCRGIERYGFVLPMDEACCTVAMDLSGRGFLKFDGNFDAPLIGNFPTEMVQHFFGTLCMNLGATVHIKVEGSNTHHMIESCFKGFAKTFNQVITIKGNQMPSTKGVL